MLGRACRSGRLPQSPVPARVRGRPSGWQRSRLRRDVVDVEGVDGVRPTRRAGAAGARIGDAHPGPRCRCREEPPETLTRKGAHPRASVQSPPNSPSPAPLTLCVPCATSSDSGPGPASPPGIADIDLSVASIKRGYGCGYARGYATVVAPGRGYAGGYSSLDPSWHGSNEGGQPAGRQASGGGPSLGCSWAERGAPRRRSSRGRPRGHSWGGDRRRSVGANTVHREPRSNNDPPSRTQTAQHRLPSRTSCWAGARSTSRGAPGTPLCASCAPHQDSWLRARRFVAADVALAPASVSVGCPLVASARCGAASDRDPRPRLRRPCTCPARRAGK